MRELDRRVGPGGRSRFIVGAVPKALDDGDDEHRWGAVEAALGALGDEGHAWDEDPAAWVRETRGTTR